MSNKQNEVIAFVGRKADGKTTLAKAQALCLGKPVIIINPALEFEKAKYRHFFNSVAEFKKWIEIPIKFKLFRKANNQLVLNIRSFEDVEELATVLTKDSRFEDITVLFDEGDLYIKNTLQSKDELFNLAYTSRNRSQNIIIVFKRPAYINKLYLGTCDEVYVSKLYENADIKYFKDRDRSLVSKIKNLNKNEFLVVDGANNSTKIKLNLNRSAIQKLG